MKPLALCLNLLLSSGVAFAADNQTVGCFTSGDTNIKFVQINQGNISLGYVKYKKSDKGTPLIFVAGVSENNDDGRPEEYTSKWAELINGKVNGYYLITSQGTRFYSLEYKSEKNVVTSFHDDINAYNEDGTDCKW